MLFEFYIIYSGDTLPLLPRKALAPNKPRHHFPQGHSEHVLCILGAVRV